MTQGIFMYKTLTFFQFVSISDTSFLTDRPKYFSENKPRALKKFR